MLVKRLDKNRRLLETLKGEFKDGAFWYKPAGITNLFAKKERKALSYDDSIDEGKQKVAYTIFDGKTDKQVLFNKEGKEEDTSLNDYVREFKIAKLAEEAMVERPLGLKDAVEILFIIAMIVGFATNYFQGKQTYSLVTHIQAPLNQSVTQNAQLIRILINDSNQNHALYLRLLNKTGG